MNHNLYNLIHFSSCFIYCSPNSPHSHYFNPINKYTCTTRIMSRVKYVKIYIASIGFPVSSSKCSLRGTEKSKFFYV